MKFQHMRSTSFPRAAAVFAAALVGPIAALAFAAPASASAIYRAVQPDGRVVYGDVPPAEARVVERLEPLPPGTNVAAAVQAAPAVEAARERFQARHAAIKTAYDEMLAARERLADAEARRLRGEAPLPGERLGIAGGGSRLAPAYFERLALLDREVLEARERLRTAQDRLNQVR